MLMCRPIGRLIGRVRVNVEAWLMGLGLEQYAEAFAENGVDLSLLPDLTNEDLKDLGVDRLVDRKTILKAVARTSESEDEPAAELPAATTIAGERRQVTVLFADIAGYTKLSSELGAEETHTLLNHYFEAVDGIVDSYGGSIDKHIGDNVMAVFGAPVAHDDDPLRAVRAAVDIQQRMSDLSGEVGRALQVHIGIASGQVVASGTGSDGHREYTVTGDSVNLASRLQDKAEPGQTLIAEAVRRTVADYVECEALGDVVVKGLDEPVQVWRVEALRDVAEDATRTAFVGRQAELRQFFGAVEACRETSHGEAIIVRGEAGIGKTRLVEEFTAAAVDKGFAIHRGLFLDFGVGKGQDAIRTIVRSLLGIPRGSGKVARQGAAEAALAERRLATDQRVFLNDLLDLPQPIEERAMYDAMDNATRNTGKRDVVAELIKAVSARAPILIIVEDAHWADPLMLTHLASMTATVADCPAMLVMTSRIEGDPLDQVWRSSTRGSPLMTIDLGPLREADAIVMAGAFIDATNQFAKSCIERAEGNPLFLEQLLRNAEEQGEEDMPASIQSLVLARMDRLSANDKRALQAASVIGQRFALDALRHVLDDADYACTGLIEHHLVRPEGDDFLFAHALIQEGVYGSLLKATRHALHVRAAEGFANHDLVLRAQHLDRADDPGAPKAYLEAAQVQASLYHYEGALRLVERGRELAEGTADEFALTSLHGEFLHDVGMVAESMAAHRRALELATDDIDRCKSWIGIAAGLRLSNEYNDALELLEQAEPIAAQHDLTLDLAQLHHLRGNLYFVLGNVDACGEAHGKALAFARKAGSAEAEARSLGGMADAAYARGQMASAHRYFSDCVALCRQQGFGRIEVANLAMVGWTLHYLNELQLALDTTLAAVESSKKVGDRRAELNSVDSVIRIMYELGDTSRAPALMERERELIEQLSARAWEPTIGWHLAMLHETEGRHRQAIDEMELGVAMARERSVGFLAPRMLAYLAMITDDPIVRRDALNEAEAMMREGSIGSNFLGVYRYAMDAYLRSGDWDEVERYAAALEDFTRPEPLPQSDLFIARARVLAAYGRGKRDDATMQELKRLRDEAKLVGFKTALPSLEEALATI